MNAIHTWFNDTYPGVLVIAGMAVLHSLIQVVHGRRLALKGE